MKITRKRNTKPCDVMQIYNKAYFTQFLINDKHNKQKAFQGSHTTKRKLPKSVDRHTKKTIFKK